MWLLEAIGIPFNPADGTIVLPLWAAGAILALALILLLVAIARAGAAGTLVFLALVGFGSWAVWAWTAHEQALERQSIESRLTTIEAQAFAPGSVLGCLGVQGSGPMDAACEAAVFASGDTAAAAVGYTAARFEVLDQATALARDGDPALEPRVSALRRNLEQDRFGLVSHVLSSRPNCTAERCDALKLFSDPERLRANLRDDVFGAHVARAEARWSTVRTARPAATSDDPPSERAGAPGTPLPPGYTLPSSESIPPVSIMTAEPSAAAPSAASTAAPATATASPQATTPTPPPRPARLQRPAQQRAAPQEPTRGLPAPPRTQ